MSVMPSAKVTSRVVSFVYKLIIDNFLGLVYKQKVLNLISFNEKTHFIELNRLN